VIDFMVSVEGFEPYEALLSGELGNRLLNRQRHLRHSDKEKFRSDLNRPESCKMSERLLKKSRKSGDFQAEYRLPPTLSGCSSRCFE
jgi:hypothetical protein